MADIYSFDRDSTRTIADQVRHLETRVRNLQSRLDMLGHREAPQRDRSMLWVEIAENWKKNWKQLPPGRSMIMKDPKLSPPPAGIYKEEVPSGILDHTDNPLSATAEHLQMRRFTHYYSVDAYVLLEDRSGAYQKRSGEEIKVWDPSGRMEMKAGDRAQVAFNSQSDHYEIIAPQEKYGLVPLLTYSPMIHEPNHQLHSRINDAPNEQVFGNAAPLSYDYGMADLVYRRDYTFALANLLTMDQLETGRGFSSDNSPFQWGKNANSQAPTDGWDSLLNGTAHIICDFAGHFSSTLPDASGFGQEIELSGDTKTRLLGSAQIWANQFAIQKRIGSYKFTDAKFYIPIQFQKRTQRILFRTPKNILNTDLFIHFTFDELQTQNKQLSDMWILSRDDTSSQGLIFMGDDWGSDKLTIYNPHSFEIPKGGLVRIEYVDLGPQTRSVNAMKGAWSIYQADCSAVVLWDETPTGEPPTVYNPQGGGEGGGGEGEPSTPAPIPAPGANPDDWPDPFPFQGAPHVDSPPQPATPLTPAERLTRAEEAELMPEWWADRPGYDHWVRDHADAWKKYYEIQANENWFTWMSGLWLEAPPDFIPWGSREDDPIGWRVWEDFKARNYVNGEWYRFTTMDSIAPSGTEHLDVGT